MRHKKTLSLPGIPRDEDTPASSPGPRTKRRFLVAHLPCFRLERCGWRADEAVVLLAEERSALRVQAMTGEASRMGIRKGMAIAEARVLNDDRVLEVELAPDPEEEARDLQALSRLLDPLSPEHRALGEDALFVELSRSRRSEGECLRRAREILEEVGHSCQIVIADEPAGALALAAHGGGHRVVPPGQLPRALSKLPVAALEPLEDVRESLQSVGVLKLGQLAALPAASVARRFGAEGLRLHRIARGEAPLLPTASLPSSATLVLRRQLPEPVIQLEAVVFVLNDLVARLQQVLSAAERAAVRLQLRLGLEDSPDFLLPIRLGQPRRGARELMEVLRKRLEGVRLRSTVTDVAIEVLEDVAFLGRQRGLLDRRDARESLGDLLGRLADTLGEQRLFSPQPVERHRPECSWAARVFRERAREPIRAEGAQRPCVLLRDPLPLRVEGDPITAVEIEGRWCRVDDLESRLPERLCGEWWEDDYLRDYYTATLCDGRRAWFFQDHETGEWWLHGWWD